MTLHELAEALGLYGGGAGALLAAVKAARFGGRLFERLVAMRHAKEEGSKANQVALTTSTSTNATSVTEFIRQLHELEGRVKALELQLEQRTKERDEAVTAKHAAIVDRDLAKAAADRAQAELEKARADRDAAIARRDEAIAIASAWEARAQEAVMKARESAAEAARWLAHANGAADELGRLLSESWASPAHAGLESEHFDEKDTLPPVPPLPPRAPRGE